MTTPSRSPSADGPAGPSFVHLKVHSAYSLLEGALPIPKLAKLAVGYGFPALGLTDTNNLFGALEFSDKLADAGIQPIIGVALNIDFEERQPDAMERAATPQRKTGDGPLALLATSEAGYANLMKLVSRAHLEAADVQAAHATATALDAHADGLIVLTGGPDGPIDRALREGQHDLAEARLKRLKAAFGDRLYVEIQRHGLKSEHDVEPQLLQLAYALELPIVATNEAYFATPDDYEAHDALLCIAEGRYVVEDDRRRVTPEHYFKGADADGGAVRRSARGAREHHRDRQALRLPSQGPQADPAALRCRRRLHQRDRAVAARGRRAEAPGRAGLEGSARRERAGARLHRGRLRAAARLRARRHRAHEVPRLLPDRRRLHQVVEGAAAFPVGPGRGSGAGSVVAWSLTITDLDPLRFGLLFERFLNPERVSMPDFDIDFCQDRRDEVIRYVQEKYGADRVAQIITHGKLQARAVLRDVGRVLQMPYGQVDRLCKLVPNNPANPVTLPEAIAGEPKLQEAQASEPLVARLLEIAQKLEGLYRHASTHAAGMVIADRPLDELVPLTRDPKSNTPVTQYNWKLVEAAGLVKFDFLGLKTLTVLKKAVDLVKRGRGIDVDLAALPLDDRKSPTSFSPRPIRSACSSWKSTGMRESLKRLRPDRFEDIIAMVALYRPGPMDNIPTYINRKHGEEPVDCLHPMLEGDPQGDLRRHHLPGAGDPDRAGDGRLHARPGRHAPARHGQEGQGRDGPPRGALRRGRRRARRQEGGRQGHLRARQQVRRLRLQQEPRGRLRARQLSHRLHEGELPRGVPRRLHDARHGQHRQAGAVCSRGEEERHRGEAAVRQRVRGGFPRRALARRRRRPVPSAIRSPP